jgi:hypothetical protein
MQGEFESTEIDNFRSGYRLNLSPSLDKIVCLNTLCSYTSVIIAASVARSEQVVPALAEIKIDIFSDAMLFTLWYKSHVVLDSRRSIPLSKLSR